MNRITPLAETTDTVTLSRADYEALLDAREDAIDLAALRAQDEREARLGEAAARADFLPVERVRRILAGESPVRVWREHRAMTLRDLSAAAGVGASYLSEIETGRKPGSAAALARIARALGVAVEDLLPEDGPPAPPERE
jgi:DNA-binding Xre family transcriptional regulator